MWPHADVFIAISEPLSHVFINWQAVSRYHSLTAHGFWFGIDAWLQWETGLQLLRWEGVHTIDLGSGLHQWMTLENADLGLVLLRKTHVKICVCQQEFCNMASDWLKAMLPATGKLFFLILIIRILVLHSEMACKMQFVIVIFCEIMLSPISAISFFPWYKTIIILIRCVWPFFFKRWHRFGKWRLHKFCCKAVDSYYWFEDSHDCSSQYQFENSHVGCFACSLPTLTFYPLSLKFVPINFTLCTHNFFIPISEPHPRLFMSWQAVCQYLSWILIWEWCIASLGAVLKLLRLGRELTVDQGKGLDHWRLLAITDLKTNGYGWFIVKLWYLQYSQYHYFVMYFM